MRFAAGNLLLNAPDLVTCETTPPHEKLTDAVRWAVWAERAGFDAVGIGERHAAPFLSSSPTVFESATAVGRLLADLAVGAPVDAGPFGLATHAVLH